MNGISIREYARARGVTMTGVYRKIWEGRLSALKIDGKWQILGTKTTESPEQESLEGRAHESA